MSKSILIGNLPTDTTEEGLQEWLGEVREEIAIAVELNQAGGCRGFARIEVASEEVMQFILDRYDRTEFGGRIVFMHKTACDKKPQGGFLRKVLKIFGIQPHPDRAR